MVLGEFEKKIHCKCFKIDVAKSLQLGKFLNQKPNFLCLNFNSELLIPFSMAVSNLRKQISLGFYNPLLDH